MKAQVVGDYICDGLRISSRTGTAAINVIRYFGQFVRDAVGDVGAVK